MKQFFTRKPLLYKERKELIKHFYADIAEEYTEQNMPTDLWTAFTELLDTIPKDHLTSCNTLGLFESALKEVVGANVVKKENIKKENTKKYI